PISGLSYARVQDFIFSVNKDKKEGGYLYREFRLKFPRVWDELMEEFFKSVGFVPLYELAVSILSKFGIIKNFPENQGFFMRFLELIKEQEKDYPSIAVFLEFFDNAQDEDLYVNISESDSVKVLTIHKSKGLEFPVVIMPFLEMNPKVEPEVVVSADNELRLVRIKKSYADFSPSIDRIYRSEYLKSLVDELCGIYVSFTRPKDELYIFISPKAETGVNLAGLLLPENNYESGAKRDPEKKDAKKSALTLEIPPSEYKDWVGLLKDEFIDRSVLELRDRILSGDILHCILSFIGNLYAGDKEAAIKAALDKTKMKFPFVKDFSGFERMVRGLLSNKEMSRYFEIKGAEVYLEKEMVNTFGDTKRIDRFIKTAESAVIIDYKSAKDPAAGYHGQVREYMGMVKEIYPGLEVKGVLIYLDDLTSEEVSWSING
ncbi:MAG: 3'-5' exonuclease, partial [Candidatus Omnitrophica bacterium]|nr:3'-5' exonuclease [Candidatus Omnitrophota bacterium]